jgi:hypothetical protein
MLFVTFCGRIQVLRAPIKGDGAKSHKGGQDGIENDNISLKCNKVSNTTSISMKGCTYNIQIHGCHKQMAIDHQIDKNKTNITRYVLTLCLTNLNSVRNNNNEGLSVKKMSMKSNNASISLRFCSFRDGTEFGANETFGIGRPLASEQ